MEFVWWGLALIAVAFAIELYYLRGEDLCRFDRPQPTPDGVGSMPSEEHAAVVASLGEVAGLIKDVPRSQHIPVLRKYMDGLFGIEPGAAQITPVDAGGVPAEWVLAPGVDSQRRFLYIHGGAFTMGSPTSHRRLTAKFSELADAAVLAIDYRLMPEHPRMAGVEDCRTAYQWMLDNGPAGPHQHAPASAVFVGGDSAGGNLTLSLIAWVRDQKLRAPNAAIALSPATDSTLDSPSLKGNLATDPMLGPLFGALVKVPRSMLLWFGWMQNRMRPSDPVISPVFGNLAGLPPTLVHASDAEMLRDDSVRYVNRAKAAGSPVTLQTWSHMVHVWHFYHPQLAEGRAAMEEFRKFLRSHS
jgi:epsilon-lactone hydrolase